MSPVTLSGPQFSPLFGSRPNRSAIQTQISLPVSSHEAAQQFGCSKMEGDSVQFSGSCAETNPVNTL